ncbi:hypothetical protein H4R18_004039 [Coemansia javaensis]|uniref:Peptidase S1 domain-containing protein n=1 Tax=Coemansia javaensis TaxID=2761396 RepID=A0A9W8H5C9_9FUNG|nr:hypothetical protein H4R18_004039 [Coemansia javaensis]
MWGCRFALALVAGLSAVSAATPGVRLVGSGQAQAELAAAGRAPGHGVAVRQNGVVVSGGIGFFDGTDSPRVTVSGGSVDADGSKVLGPDVRRQLAGIKGALLMRNGAQTLCEVAMVTQRYGFVAASCIDYLEGSKNVDPSFHYSVHLSQNVDQFYADTNIEAVIPHPDYNPKTFENNIALVMTVSDPATPYFNPIADWPSDWTELLYVHRSVTDGPNPQWNEPYVLTTNKMTEVNTNLPACKEASALFAANPDSYMCNTATLTYFYRRDCNIPYGVVYGIYNTNAAAAAIYSHSAIYGDGFCGTGKIYNYYLQVRNYIKWAEGVAGITVGTFHSSNPPGYVRSNNPNYTINPPGGPNDAGVNIFGNFTLDAVRLPSTDEPRDASSLGQPQPIDEINNSQSGEQEPSANAAGSSSSSSASVSVSITTTTVSASSASSLAAPTPTSTPVATQQTTETATSTEVVTSTTVVTVSTIVVVSENSPGAHATPAPGENMTNTLIISPTFYTVTATTTQTVTFTQPASFPGTTYTLSGPSEGPTVTVTVTAAASAPGAVTTTAVSTAEPSTVTVTMVSVQQMLPATPTPTTSETGVTVTSVTTITAEPSSSHVEGPDEPASGSRIPLIVGIILLLLLLLGLLYYLCVARRRRGASPTTRVRRWWFAERLFGGARQPEAPPSYYK